jgi:hypothetical protein
MLSHNSNHNFIAREFASEFENGECWGYNRLLYIHLYKYTYIYKYLELLIIIITYFNIVIYLNNYN